MSSELPVLFDGDDNQVIGSGVLHEDGLVITVKDLSFVDQLRQFDANITAINLSFRVHYDIPMPGDIDGR